MTRPTANGVDSTPLAHRTRQILTPLLEAAAPVYGRL